MTEAACQLADAQQLTRSAGGLRQWVGARHVSHVVQPGAMDRTTVEQWVAFYERLWRTPGTELLAELFVPDASYLPSPWAQPLQGLEAIARFWEAERMGADEVFTMSSDVEAVDETTAVVRVVVEYGASRDKPWRDLWVLRFAADGRCSWFEEWPFAPGQPDGH